jgi:hypothetical protein
MTHERTLDDRAGKAHKPPDQDRQEKRPGGPQKDKAGLASLQQLVGNRAVQRLLVTRNETGPLQRSGGGDAFDLDDETASRINRERGGGQPLDTSFQRQASEATGQDLDGVRVHSSPEADDLSHQLSAKAFTTGQDIFFREGAYDPHSSGGRQLIAHELTHVVQQSSGAVGDSAGQMRVNPPDDAFERQADAVATAVGREGTSAEIQRQTEPEEEEEEEGPQGVQRQEMEQEHQ